MKKYLSTQEAAAIAGRKDTSTIRKAILNGWLKAEKFGRDWMIAEKDLQKWLDEGRHVYPILPKE